MQPGTLAVLILASQCYRGGADVASRTDAIVDSKDYNNDMNDSSMQPLSPSFRLGSGAKVLTHGSTRQLAEVQGLKPTDRITLVEGKSPKPVSSIVRTHTIMSPIVCIGILIMMVPMQQAQQGGGSRDFNYRIPPAWSPENENNYSFRAL